MAEILIAPRFLFRFSAPLAYQSPLWPAKGKALGEAFRLTDLSELDGEKPFGDVRVAWSEEGLLFSATVSGKKQPLWCRDSRTDDSDGFQVWIDTRDTHNIHRASRFCHRFVMLPAGGGRKNDKPYADQLVIPRARENAPPIRPEDLRIHSAIRKDGYSLLCMIPAAALQGFDTEEHSRIGFTYALFDRELGLQTFSTGSEFPYEEDPSTWGTLELVGQ